MSHQKGQQLICPITPIFKPMKHSQNNLSPWKFSIFTKNSDVANISKKSETKKQRSKQSIMNFLKSKNKTSN